MPQLPEIVAHLDARLRIAECGDWSHALNGLQVENSGRVRKIGAAVDASTRTFRLAAEAGVDLLLVHHGLFWPGLQPVTGAFHRQLAFLLEHDIALYSAHLPLDVHPELGNNALLVAALGLTDAKPFLEGKGQLLGLQVEAAVGRADLVQRFESSLGGPVQVFGHGPETTLPDRRGNGRRRLGDLRCRASWGGYFPYWRGAALGRGGGGGTGDQSFARRTLRHGDVWGESPRRRNRRAF